jgi:O-antigen ligase
VILLLLCFVSGLIPARYNPYLQLAGRGFFVSDLLLILLLAVLTFQLIADRKSRYLRTPLDAPLLFFCAAVVGAIATAVVNHGITFSDATYEARTLLYYLIFFPVIHLIRTKAQVARFVRGILVIGLLVAGTVIVQASVARSFALMDASILQGDAQLIRFYHPGFLVVYAALMTLMCSITIRGDRRHRWFHLVLIVLLGASIFLTTVTRNVLVSTSISFAVLMLVLRGSQRSRLVGNLWLTACIAAGFAAVLGIMGRESLAMQYLSALVGRISRMFSPAILTSEETLVFRWREIQHAWPHIARHPLTGIGLETAYRPPFFEGDPLTAYVHNAYISLWLKTGLLGLVPFLAVSVRFLRRGFRLWRDVQDGFLQAVSLGLTLTYLSLMISSLVAPFLVANWSLAIFGVMLGINETIWMHDKATEIS